MIDFSSSEITDCVDSCTEKEIKNSLENLAGLPPILQNIYARRGVCNLSELDYRLSALLPYSGFLDIEKPATRLSMAFHLEQHILIVGDFDTDGATATALAVDALRQLGSKKVSYLVPNRFTCGYGLTPKIVDLAILQKPDVIITVDNGISSFEGVEAANAAGIDVIITDHHLAGEDLPKAYAIVNPNQPNDLFPSKHIAGVGVIFYLMLALRHHLEQQNWFNLHQLLKPNLAQFLDLVALGTVADVVKLDHNNRTLVHQGLLRIQRGQTRPGILALLQVSRRVLANLQTSDLGFALGPRLNAAGRLDDMSLGVNCLLSQEIGAALNLAEQLDELNQERRALEKQMQQEALSIVEHLNLAQKLPPGVCLYDETWHQGIVGLVAGRVKEKIYRPVIAFARIDTGFLKGSARSIPGLSIREVLAIIDYRFPHLISQFGGHAMAAGLSIEEKNYAEFTHVFAQIVMELTTPEILQPKWEHDGALEWSKLNLETAKLLKMSGPWGEGFPEPIFFGRFILLNQRLVGEHHLKMTLRPELFNTADRGYINSINAIAFEIDKKEWPNYDRDQIECWYRLDINDYQNKKSLQLIVEKLL